MVRIEGKRDHGGGIDAARARYGGARADWLDLSTGINPVPYPLGEISQNAWTALPDKAAFDRLEIAARGFWNIPDEAAVLAAPGASVLIARLPSVLSGAQTAWIPGPTYNEWAAGFRNCGWVVQDQNPDAGTQVFVHPNNPDGTYAPAPLQEADDVTKDILTIYDESFCDTVPEDSYINATTDPRYFVVKSFGKFWGLAGLRLGFLIGPSEPLERLADMMGPWPVSGPALEIGARALQDHGWAKTTRLRLNRDYKRLDALMKSAGASAATGTPLFRLYSVDDAAKWQDRLARHHIWSRIFPYSKHFLRLGLPGSDQNWARLEAALC